MGAIAISTALRAYQPAREQPRWTGQSFWKLVTGELQLGNLPFARVALANIAQAPVSMPQKVAFLEKILANPRHPLLIEAINFYASVGKPCAVAAVTETLEGILQSSAYSKAVKTTTREALATINLQPASTQ